MAPVFQPLKIQVSHKLIHRYLGSCLPLFYVGLRSRFSLGSPTKPMFCPYKRSPCHSGLVKILLPLVALTTNHVLLLIRHSLLISFKHCLTSSQFTKHFYIAYLILLMSRGKCPHPHFIYKTPEAQNDQVTCPGIHLSSKLWIISLCLPHKYHNGLNPGSLNQSSLFFLSIIKPS